jgi:hypothetical protein
MAAENARDTADGGAEDPMELLEALDTAGPRQA